MEKSGLPHERQYCRETPCGASTRLADYTMAAQAADSAVALQGSPGKQHCHPDWRDSRHVPRYPACPSSSRPWALVGFIASGLFISVLINFVLLKLALYPLYRLRETMRLVQSGDLTRKAPITGQDADADQLAIAFNTMLAALDDLGDRAPARSCMRRKKSASASLASFTMRPARFLTSLLISLALLEETCTEEAARERI